MSSSQEKDPSQREIKPQNGRIEQAVGGTSLNGAEVSVPHEEAAPSQNAKAAKRKIPRGRGLRLTPRHANAEKPKLPDPIDTRVEERIEDGKVRQYTVYILPSIRGEPPALPSRKIEPKDGTFVNRVA
jgi:hypothetical protein